MTAHSFRLKHDPNYKEAIQGMTPARREMAVKVAMDVVQSLHQYTVLSGNGYVVMDDESLEKYQGKSLQTVLSKVLKEQNCEVCGLGACFLSLVRLDNKFDIPKTDGEALDTAAMAERLHKVFTSLQMELIESAFEQGIGGGLHDYVQGVTASEGLEQDAINFSVEQDDSERLKKIMLNIVTNEGVFVP